MEKLTKKEDHPNYRPGKGCVVGYDGKVMLLQPGDNFTDVRGRKYLVSEDGSLRRVKRR